MSNRSFVQAVILGLLLVLGATIHGYLSGPAAAVRQNYAIFKIESQRALGAPGIRM